jgi:hypothetical protein
MSQLEKQLDRDVKTQRKLSDETLPAWAREKQEKPLKNRKKKKKKK